MDDKRGSGRVDQVEIKVFLTQNKKYKKAEFPFPSSFVRDIIYLYFVHIF